MRMYPTSAYEWQRLATLNAEPWMVELLKLNPDYTSWGPGEDYMLPESSKTWSGGITYPNWNQVDIVPDDLNVIVNFYFRLHRASTRCQACGGSGYAPDARRLMDTFYGFDSESSRWCDAISLDEAQALVDAGRLRPFEHKTAIPRVDDDFVRVINDANAPGRRPGAHYVHDGVNRDILVATRCTRLGYAVTCPSCLGECTLFTESTARVHLVLWLLHPRKGASRGCLIDNIQQVDLSAVFARLRLAAEQNAQRFGKIPTTA